MKRKIMAIIEVDDDAAFEKIDDGPVAYLEREFGWLEQSGIRLEDCFIADDDECNEWQSYVNYLANWAFDHNGQEHIGSSPVCFDEWDANEFRKL